MTELEKLVLCQTDEAEKAGLPELAQFVRDVLGGEVKENVTTIDDRDVLGEIQADSPDNSAYLLSVLAAKKDQNFDRSKRFDVFYDQMRRCYVVTQRTKWMKISQ